MKEVIQKRTFDLALEVVRICGKLPGKQEFWVIGKQLMRSATSVAANYRAVSRAKSDSDFLYKLKVVEEESDESIFWMDMLLELEVEDDLKARLRKCRNEMGEILKIVVASLKTVRGRT